MKVGVISDSPFLTTGYGVPTRNLCQRFHEAGLEVVCLGIHQIAFGYYKDDLPYRVWPTCPHDAQGTELMEFFLKFEKPDVVLLINTLPVCHDWILQIRKKLKNLTPILIYFSAEGAPLSSEWFVAFRFVQGAVGWTEFTQKSAKEAYNLKTGFVYMGVDHDIFYPYQESLRRKMRKAVGWDDRFVVMSVGRNMFTKQQDKIIEAASLLKAQGCDDVLIHLQCKPFDNYENGGWDLPSLVQNWDVKDFISFPPDLLDQKFATPHGRDMGKWTPTKDEKTNLASLSLAARYNCADLYIHPSMVEGFSFPCAESMACGIPIAHTDDGGVMNEVCGSAGFRIPRITEVTAPWGSKYSVLSASAIADAIMHLRDLFQKSPEERERMQKLSVNQSSRYNWDRTAETIIKHLEKAAAAKI